MSRPIRLCQCGCGTVLGKSTFMFTRSHYRGAFAVNWNGGTSLQRGYVLRRDPSHPRQNNGYVREHILIAERALGKSLPERAVVHHVNGIKSDNRPENLVICENTAYHGLLHARQRVLDAGGNPNTHKICWACHELTPTLQFNRNRSRSDGLSAVCKRCDHKQHLSACDICKRDTANVYQVANCRPGEGHHSDAWICFSCYRTRRSMTCEQCQIVPYPSSGRFNASKTACRNGHPYDAIQLSKSGKVERYCLTCNRERSRINYLRRQAERMEAQ